MPDSSRQAISPSSTALSTEDVPRSRLQDQQSHGTRFRFYRDEFAFAVLEVRESAEAVHFQLVNELVRVERFGTA
jgi:hypothetical protein